MDVVNIYEPPITDHSELDNLDYASAGHTGFEASLGVPPASTDYYLTSDTDGSRDWGTK